MTSHAFAIPPALDLSLRAITAYSNPSNHPGKHDERSLLGVDFKDNVTAVRALLRYALHELKDVLGETERTFRFQQYVHRSAQQDATRLLFLEELLAAGNQATAYQLLFLSLSDTLELTEALLRLPRISVRQYESLLGGLLRDVHRSRVHRSEAGPVDETGAPDHVLGSGRARALSTVTFARVRRALSILVAGSDPHLQIPILSLVRSELRNWLSYLELTCPRDIARGIERHILRLPANELTLSRDALRVRIDEGRRLAEALRELALEHAASLAYVFEHLRPEISIAEVEQLVSQLEEDFLLLAKAQLRSMRQDELVQSIWLFGRVVNGFIAKAKSSAHRATANEPAYVTDFGFADDFTRYCRDLGSKLLRQVGQHVEAAALRPLLAIEPPEQWSNETIVSLLYLCESAETALAAWFRRISDDGSVQDAPRFDKRKASALLRQRLKPAQR